MDILIVAGGALGAWLLVAGPLFQASLELQEQEFDREAWDRLNNAVEAPPVSPWWWLLPPVALLLQHRRSTARHAAVMATLGPRETEQTVSFLNKATGWLVVALGALLIAVKESFELVELLHWPIGVFWVIVVVAPLLSVGNVVAARLRTAQALRRAQ